MKSHRKRVAVMHWKDPHCWWCGILTVFTVPGRKQGVKFRVPGNMATYDHLYSKLHVPRKSRKIPGVLACHSCNKWRGNLETKWNSPEPKRNAQARRMVAQLPKTFIRDPLEHLYLPGR